ncbi:uncharacterized protein LOC131234464 isoform X2 [Magnolia sinica]|nr:uncharacterized protein LOC131234464 isoform X2 [Magnolia sinica]
MLGEVLCARPRPWIGAPPLIAHRLGSDRPVSPSGGRKRRRSCCGYHHSGTCHGGGAASIWHVITPSGGGGSDGIRRNIRAARLREEGSWNAAWDVRPARWLQGPDSAWMLFGVCACFEPLDGCGNPVAGSEVEEEGSGANFTDDGEAEGDGACYRVIGVPADGRCLFRAIAHGACLIKGKEAPDETRQRELADDLRAQVVEELLKRRDETESFIEGDFDAYVKSIQQPYTWAGEPELRMASHVLGTPISVFMVDRSSDSLINVASYGKEYGKDTDSPIKVLFHGYGHYDALEVFSS